MAIFFTFTLRPYQKKKTWPKIFVFLKNPIFAIFGKKSETYGKTLHGNAVFVFCTNLQCSVLLSILGVQNSLILAQNWGPKNHFWFFLQVPHSPYRSFLGSFPEPGRSPQKGVHFWPFFDFGTRTSFCQKKQKKIFLKIIKNHQNFVKLSIFRKKT